MRRKYTFTIGGKPTEFTVIHIRHDGTEFDPKDIVIDSSTEAGRRALKIMAGILEEASRKANR